MVVCHSSLPLAHSILVPGEHFVLKDLPFYKVARLANAEAT